MSDQSNNTFEILALRARTYRTRRTLRSEFQTMTEPHFAPLTRQLPSGIENMVFTEPLWASATRTHLFGFETPSRADLVDIKSTARSCLAKYLQCQLEFQAPSHSSQFEHVISIVNKFADRRGNISTSNFPSSRIMISCADSNLRSKRILSNRIASPFEVL